MPAKLFRVQGLKSLWSFSFLLHTESLHKERKTGLVFIDGIFRGSEKKKLGPWPHYDISFGYLQPVL